jgi:hypothetical protein
VPFVLYAIGLKRTADTRSAQGAFPLAVIEERDTIGHGPDALEFDSSERGGQRAPRTQSPCSFSSPSIPMDPLDTKPRGGYLAGPRRAPAGSIRSCTNVAPRGCNQAARIGFVR